MTGLDGLSRPLVSLYEQLTSELLVNIARHFQWGSAAQDSGFSWQTRKLAEMGQLTRENLAIIRRYSGAAEGLADEALTQAVLAAIEDCEPALAAAAKAGLLGEAVPPGVSPGITQALKSYQAQAICHLNLVNTVMLDSSAQLYREGVFIAQQILNEQTGTVITGISSRQEALRTAIKQMAEKGMTGFVDHGGHRWSPEAYVNMDIRSTAGNVAFAAVKARNADYGNDLVWVRTKAAARPKCYPWQGKVISMNGRRGVTVDGSGHTVPFISIQDTSYGEPDGLFGINCGHTPPNVFIPGASLVRDENRRSEAQNEREYQQSQQQRKLERDVRDAKREAAMLDAAGDKEGFEAAALKAKQKQGELNDFCRATGRTLRSDRAQVLGYNRSVAGKANQVGKLPDVPILKSVGAKGVNYDIKDLSTGEKFRFVEGTKIQNAEVFAGKGSNKPFVKAEKYAARYGGAPADWQHAKGVGILDVYGEAVKAEVHWVQSEKAGKHEFFVKEWLE